MTNPLTLIRTTELFGMSGAVGPGASVCDATSRASIENDVCKWFTPLLSTFM